MDLVAVPSEFVPYQGKVKSVQVSLTAKFGQKCFQADP